MAKESKTTRTDAQTNEASPPIIRSADHRLIYCNHVRFAMSLYDLRIHIGRATEEVPGGALVIEEPATIAMSMHEAKAFAHMLMGAVTNYEAQFGELAMGPKKNELTQS